MDHGILWLERLSSWMENKTEPLALDDAMIDLRKEWAQTARETDTLLQTSDSLHTAFSRLKGRYEHRS